MAFSVKDVLRGRAPLRLTDVVRGAFGAAAGVAFTGLAARVLIGGGWSPSPLLVAPIGASAVLAFAVPASPLAQPRAVLLGNMASVLIGCACAALIPQAWAATGLAVGLAILVMGLLGCLHPPGGAVALMTVLSWKAGEGWRLPLEVGVCSLLLVGAAIGYARLTRRSYPHRVPQAVSAHATADPPPADRLGYTSADLDQALARYGDLLDVSREDLDALFREVELQAHHRIHSRIRCDEIMSRDVISVDAAQSADSALTFLQQHDLRTAPVIDGQGRLVGLVRRAELMAGRKHKVEVVLDPIVQTVKPAAPIEALLPLLSSGQTHEVMVVDEARRLVGVITQTDLIAVLYRAHVVEAVVAAEAA